MLRINFLAVMCVGLLLACGSNELGAEGLRSEEPVGVLRAAAASSVLPSTMAFGEQKRGTTSAFQEVTITNGTNQDQNCTLTIAAGEPFHMDRGSNGLDQDHAVSVKKDGDSGDTRTFKIVFKPTAVGAATGTFSVSCSGSNGVTPISGSVSLNGTGVTSAALDSTALTFGPQKTNTTSQSQSVVLSNSSTAFNITGVSVTGPFQVTDADLNASSGLTVQVPGATAGVNGSRSISVVFNPTAGGEGTRQGLLTITTDEQSTFEVDLSGEEVALATLVSPRPLPAFGDQRVGTISGSQAVTVHNAGETPLAITASTMGSFALVAAPSTPLAAGDSQEVLVTFNPTAQDEELVQGELTITTDEQDPIDPSKVVSVPVGLSGRAVKPAFDSTTIPLDFTTQRVGVPVTKTVTVTNTGTDSIEITGSTLTQSGTTEFALVSSTPALPTTLAPDGSLTLEVSFNPSTEVGYTGTLTLNTDYSAISSLTVPLTGTGMKPNLELSPASFGFGTRRVNSFTTQTVTVTNTGTGPIKLTGSTLTHISGTTEFALVTSSPDLSTAPTLAAKGGSLTLTVSFTPSDATTFSGTLTLTTEDHEFGSIPITLSGRGALPQLIPNPNPLDFGNLRVGSSSTTTVTVTNNGLLPINITSITQIGDQAFTYVSPPSFPVPLAENGGSLTLTVSFNPGSEAIYAGTLTLNTDDPDLRSVSIGLTGSAGLPQLEVAPATGLAFNDVRVDTQLTKTLKVTNIGTGPIDITTISTAGSTAFSITLPTNLNIARTLKAKESLDISVKFYPRVEDSFSGALTLTTDYESIPAITVPLSGKGVKPRVELSPTPLDFSAQPVSNPSEPRMVQVKNTGTGKVDISAVSIAGSTAFTVSSSSSSASPIALPFTLLPNDSKDLWVTFNPNAKGLLTGTLSVTTDEAVSSANSIALSGTGITVLSMTPADTLDFGPVPLNEKRSTTVTLSNNTGASITISSASVVSAPFVVSGLTIPKTLNPWTSTTFTVEFTPTYKGPVSTVLNLANDASNSELLLTLKGSGAVPEGQFSLPGGAVIASLDFGGVQKDTTKQITVRFTNVGDAPLAFSQPVMETSGTIFSYLGPSSMTLQPNTYMDFQVSFRPPNTITYTNTLKINWTPGSNVSALSLLGTGAVPEVKLDRSKIFFGDVRVGSNSESVAVTINNTGNADVTLLGLPVVGPFIVALPVGVKLPAKIPAFGSLSFDVIFRPAEPTAVGQVTTGSVSVITDISDSTLPPVELSGRGIISVAHLPESSLNLVFGSQRVTHASGAQPVLIHNTGQAELEISGFIFSNSAFYFDPPPTMPLKLGSGVQQAISVKFKPSTLGPISGKLSIISNAFVPAADVNLSGLGVDGRISLDPSVVAFTNVDVGGAGAQKNVVLKNTGGYPLTITGVSPPTDSSFSVLGLPDGANQSLILQPNETWPLTVTFAPTRRGYFSATAIIGSDAVLNPSFNMGLEGTGVSAAVELQPSNINFGWSNVKVSTTYGLSIKNGGEKDLVVANITFEDVDLTLPGAALDFSVGSGVSFPLTVTPGQSVIVPLKFAPQQLGLRKAKGIVNTNVGDAVVNLQGEGTSPNLQLSSIKLDFGDVLVGTPSEPSSLTLTNTGSGPLTVKSITLGGADVASFIVAKPELPLVLERNASMSLSVTLTPTAERTFLAQMMVSTDNVDAPNANVELRGTGVRQQIHAEPNPLNFGSQLVNSNSKSRIVVITNNRKEPVTIKSITTEGPFTRDALMLPVTLEGKETGLNRLEVGVRVSPQTEGAVTGKLLVSFTDQVLEPLEVDLQATGIPEVLSVTPALLEFGGVRAGGEAQPLSFTINNLSDDEILLSKPVLVLSNGEPFDYDWAGLENWKLGARERYKVTVGYKPRVETLSQTTVQIGTRSPEWLRSATLELKGRAVARILRSNPESLDFGWVKLKAPMVSKEVSITNLSGQAQQLLVSLRDEGSPFVLDANGLADPVPAGASATFTVGFDPNTAGPVENEVRVLWQGTNLAEVVIPVKGHGQDLTGSGGGCDCSSTSTGSAGMLALLALVGLGSRRRRRG